MKCTLCHKNERAQVGRQRWCNSCRSSWMKKHRQSYGSFTEEKKVRMRARAYLNEYIRRGKIQVGSCAECGDSDVESYISDYKKPLDVVWLCHEHHLEKHNRQITNKKICSVCNKERVILLRGINNRPTCFLCLT